jgi:hypothetical protein
MFGQSRLVSVKFELPVISIATRLQERPEGGTRVPTTEIPIRFPFLRRRVCQQDQSLMPSTDGSIRIDYGYINRATREPSSSTAEKFFTRQITFPVLFTVYHTLEPHSLDLIRMPTSPSLPRVTASDDINTVGGEDQKASVPSAFRPQTSTAGLVTGTSNDDALRNNLKNSSGGEGCLLVLSVRNVYGVPFEVTLERTSDGENGKLIV